MAQRRKDLEIEGNPIPRNWEETVAACLAKDPAKRPQSVAEIANRLELASPQEGTVAEVPVKRSKKALVVATAVTVCLVAAATWYFGIRAPGEKALTKPPLPMGSQAPKEAAATTAPSPKAAETEKYGPTLLRIGAGYKIENKGSYNSLAATRYGFIDKTGHVVIEPQWEEVSDFSEGLACVKRDGKYGFIDKTGRVVIEPQCESITAFNKGFAVVKRNGKWGLIDKTGQVVIEPQWEEVSGFSGEGLVCVKRGREYGFISIKTGRVVIEPQWEGASGFFEGLACVKRGGKWGFINNAGTLVIELQWERASNFSEGLARVMQDGKYGFIDKTGRVVIEPQWDNAIWFRGGLTGVSRSGKWGFVDKAGRVVVEPQWDRWWGDLSDGVVSVERDKKCGLIDTTGRMVIEPQWEGIWAFNKGFAAVKRNGKWGLIDRTGYILIEPQWDVIDKYRESEDIPFYLSVARQEGSKVVVAWLDPTGQQIWSSDQLSSKAMGKSPAPVMSPATTPTLSLTESPVNIIQKFVESLGDNNPDTQLQFYSDKVGYYEMGKVTKATIRKDLEHDIQTWPSRVYSIHDTPKIAQLPSGAYQANFQMTYTLTNAKGVSSGVLEMTVRFQSEGETWKIFEVQKKLIVAQKKS
jgi:hypothetical protein